MLRLFGALVRARGSSVMMTIDRRRGGAGAPAVAGSLNGPSDCAGYGRPRPRASGKRV